jgi:YVTN family beta-propeller protein
VTLSLPERIVRRIILLVVAAAAACGSGTSGAGAGAAPRGASDVPSAIAMLPTGRTLDPAGVTKPMGGGAFTMVAAPGGGYVALLSGWKMQGLQVLDESGTVLQTVEQTAAFVGAAFSPDGTQLWTSGGDADVVYRYAWRSGRAALEDSVVLAGRAKPDAHGTKYPAGLGVSPDGRHVYVAENLGDAVAVVDVATRAVVQRIATGRYPYGVIVAPNGAVYASIWNGNEVLAFAPDADGRLGAPRRMRVGRHPSSMLLSRDGNRLFVASGSTDRVAVIDPRSGAMIAELNDAPPAGPEEGSTPSNMALSEDGTRLFVSEADANAVAVFDLSSATAGVATPHASDRLVGRVPTEWYPSSLAVHGDTLLVANGKGHGSRPNKEDGPGPGSSRERQGSRDAPGYTLAQIAGSITVAPVARLAADAFAPMSARVAHANRWDTPPSGATGYPPIKHVVYIIKENRTYDQVFGDLAQADGDTSMLYFGRATSPNHHALAERFGIYDRFFTNAEVSPDGHNWSTGAYTTDYLQSTIPSNYSGRGRTYDYEGLNRGWGAENEPEDDVNEPARGYLWDAAARAGVSLRNYGEFVLGEGSDASRVPNGYKGLKQVLKANTCDSFPAYNLNVADQRRADVFISELRDFERRDAWPQLMIVRLPNDHTAGSRAGSPTPRAYMADNDLALGRIVEAVSRTKYWPETAIFVLEDDAQNGPDHVDSHRSPFLLISPWARSGVRHRFANTTDVLRTIEELLGLQSLSQFDHFGRPLRDVWRSAPDATPYVALAPATKLDERNPRTGQGARLSRGLELRMEDQADEALFNRVLWLAAKGTAAPMPAPRRISQLELVRSH